MKRKFNESTYKKYGMYITPTNNGYKVHQTNEGKVEFYYERLYKTKSQAQLWVDELISKFEEFKNKSYTK